MRPRVIQSPIEKIEKFYDPLSAVEEEVNQPGGKQLINYIVT